MTTKASQATRPRSALLRLPRACPRLSELPPPPAGKRGWPWTVETPPAPERMPDGSAWPSISMVTPSYNQGAYIEETIRSVLLQGYPRLEYIVEDSSTDETVAVLQKYLRFLSIGRTLPKDGMSPNINRGWKKCAGEIVTWISSDDVYLPGAFQRAALAHKENPDAGEIVGAFHFMGSDSKIAPRAVPPRLPQGSPVDLTLEDPETWRLHQVSTFYTRRALETVGFYVREDLHHNMDREILYRVCRSFPIALVNEPLACFRQHPESKSWSLANMVKMGEEYSRVQSMFYSTNPRENARRDRIATYIKAKGYLKYSKYTKEKWPGCKALLSALRLSPRLAIKRSSVTAALNLSGLLPMTERLSRRRQKAANQNL